VSIDGHSVAGRHRYRGYWINTSGKAMPPNG
jgi:hypothetical protein